MAHANARLNLHGRRLLIERVIDHGRPVAHVAKELGVSRQCATAGSLDSARKAIEGLLTVPRDHTGVRGTAGRAGRIRNTGAA